MPPSSAAPQEAATKANKVEDANTDKDLTFQILRLLGVTPRSAEDLLLGRKREAENTAQRVLEDSGHPFGTSIFPAIFAADAAPASRKWAYVALTAVLMSCVPFVGDVLLLLLPAKGSAAVATQSTGSFLETYMTALVLTEAQLRQNLYMAALAFLALVAAHCAGVHWPGHWYDRSTNKYATSCYDEMFAEPLASLGLESQGRGRRLIARWGNTLSNGSYLVAALCVARSVCATWHSNKYAYADALFGLNLMLLTVFSTLWHATNYNKIHYLDLWAMDHAILYLLLRYAAMGCDQLLPPHWQSTPPGALFVFYVFTFYVAFRNYIGESMCAYGAGMFDKGFPPSGRRRLTLLDSAGIPDMSIAGMCLFTGLPVFYMAIPATVMYATGTVGSYAALSHMTCTLTVGWTYRMLERFCVDGLPVMDQINLHHPATKRSRLQRVCLRAAAAAISPTAVLHWLTGISLLAGYVHARSLESA